MSDTRTEVDAASSADGVVTSVPRRGHRDPVGRGRLTTVAIAVGAASIVVAHVWGRWLQSRGHRMAVNAPPLTGNVEPRVSWWSLPAIGVAAGAVGGADHVARTLPWRRLLWASFAAALTWSVALALWDGPAGLTRSAGSGVDYLAALPLVDDVGGFVRTLLSDTRSLPTHVQAHPPGMVFVLLGLESIGAATPGWVAAIEHLVGAASVPAVLLSIREIAHERAARSAAPFVAFSAIAITWSSGDAVFLGVGSWAVTLLVLATGRRGRRSHLLATAGGGLAALAMVLSYGIVLLGIVPAAVAVRRRRAGTLAIAAIPVAAGLALAALGGFWWLDGLDATRRAYALSLARVRPYSYFLFANLAAVAIAVGPSVWVGLVRLRDRGLWLLAGAALAAIVLADLSGLSKGEVERIWLPFMPWVVGAAAAAFADGSGKARRGWLGLQACWALLVQSVVVSPW